MLLFHRSLCLLKADVGAGFALPQELLDPSEVPVELIPVFGGRITIAESLEAGSIAGPCGGISGGGCIDVIRAPDVPDHARKTRGIIRIGISVIKLMVGAEEQ